MANRYWVGSSGTWDGTSTTHWSTAPAITFTASRSGTTLTTTGSPSLVIGMTVFANDGTVLGTITGGSGNSWTTSASGTQSSQLMSAATVGASVPTSSDDVYFTANSSTFISYNCQLNGVANSAVANNLFIAPTNTGNAFLNVSSGLWLYGNLSVTSNANVFFTGTSPLTLKGTSTGLTIDPGLYSNTSFPMPPLYVDCGTGSYTLANNYMTNGLTGEFRLISGTLDTNASANYSMQFFGYTLGLSSTTRSFICNYSNLISLADLSSGQNTWSATGGANLTLSAANAKISVVGANSTLQLGAYAYGNINIATNALATANIISLSTTTINTLSIGNRVSGGMGMVQISNNMSINNITALSGTDASMRTAIVAGNTSGGAYPFGGGAAPVVITSNGTISLTNVDFADITANGTSVPWSGNGLGNVGGTSNITFSAGKTVYSVATANSNWFSNNWSQTQGGSAVANDFPLAQDTVIFDATHPPAGNTVTFNSNAFVGNLNTSARTSNSLTLIAGTNTPMLVSNATLSSNTIMTASGTIGFVLNPHGKDITVTSSGANLPSGTTVAGNGDVILADNLTVTPVTNGVLSLHSATLNLNNNTANAGNFNMQTNLVRGINFGTSGALNLTGNGINVWYQLYAANYSFTGTSNINLTYSGSTGQRQVYISTGEQYAPSFNITAGGDGINIPNATYLRDLNFSNTTFTGSFINNGINLYGNLVLSNTMQAIAAASALTLTGGNAYLGTTRTITTNGKAGRMPLTVSYATNSGVTAKLQDDYIMNSAATASFTITSGTLDFNNKNATVPAIAFTGTIAKGANLGSGTINILNGATSFLVTAANTTINPGTSNIVMANTTTAKTFSGGNLAYYNLYQAGTANLTLVGNSSFNTLGSNVANTYVIFTAGTTTTVNNFSMYGNAGNLIYLRSTLAGTKFILSKSSGLVSSDYLNISDSNATGGAGWYAGLNSANTANNVGWIFSAAPVPGLVMTGGITIDVSTGGITFSS